ncbi:MAG TPA: protein translocase subunit SecF [Desulfosporosinus sp.]|nr:protein translocase subunit SecF [Desulfosporosinus sp.]
MEKHGHAATYDDVQKIHPLYFNIVKKRLWWYAISLLIIIPGVISLVMQGLNLGIDFKGGTMLDVNFNKAVTQAAITDTMKSVGLEGPVQLSDGNTTALIRTEALEEDKRAELMTALQTQVGEYDKTALKEDKVGPAIGQELARNAIYALIIAIGMMIIYITIRFEFVFAISGIIALVHDVLVVVGIFSLFQWEIDSAFVAAILTIIGYSINDTVIIFDRIRENQGKMRRADSYGDMVDKSIWQTMRRSINTSITVLIALLSLFILGGESTRMFSLAMLLGVFTGAYSSIFIASQVLLEVKTHMKKTPRKGGKGKAARA